MFRQRCLLGALAFLLVSSFAMTVVFFMVTQQYDVSPKDALRKEEENQQSFEGIEPSSTQIASTDPPIEIVSAPKQIPTTAPTLINVHKFRNPIDGDFPCLRVPIPKQPYLYVFLIIVSVLLAFGTTVIDNATELKTLIQRNTLAMLKTLMPTVFPVLFTNSTPWLRYASSLGIHCTNDYLSNQYGTPIFSSLMQYLEVRIPSTFVGYLNGDLVFHPSSLLSSLQFIASSFLPTNQFVMVMGRRYNRDMSIQDDWSAYSAEEMDAFIEQEIAFTDLFITVAQDYFIYSHQTLPFTSLEDVVIGRNGIDNYLLDYCLRRNISVIDASHSIFVIHQTDSDGNWAGSRESLDRDWNLELLKTPLLFDTLGRSPYQLLLFQEGELVLHHHSLVDNAFSPQELDFMDQFIPEKADRCLYYGKGSFKPFFEGRCDRFDVILYDVFQQKYVEKLDKHHYNLLYRNIDAKRKQSMCMNYQSYVTLPVRRAVFYDVVILDGLCKHYTAYYVLSRLKNDHTVVLIRGLDLFQYRNISSFIEKYYEKMKCLDPFPHSNDFDFVGLCAYRMKPADQRSQDSLPLWW